MGTPATIEAWVKLADEQQEIGAELWTVTQGIRGRHTDPRIVSSQLFGRAWSNARGFNLLWKSRLTLEAEIVLRSSVEAAICLANLNTRPDGFIKDLISDAASTVSGQIPIWTDRDPELGAEATKGMAEVFGERNSDGGKHKKLDFKAMAKEAGAPHLYDWHKHLSGTSAHVTGLSVMQNVTTDDDDGPFREWRDFRREHALGISCGAFQISLFWHSSLIGEAAIHERTRLLMLRMNALGPIGPEPD